jgi:hypothetical protein
MRQVGFFSVPFVHLADDQVGDRLVPIGFTSARAPGTADFSMSTGAAAAEEGGSRRSRRNTNRERELEEVRSCAAG